MLLVIDDIPWLDVVEFDEQMKSEGHETMMVTSWFELYDYVEDKGDAWVYITVKSDYNEWLSSPSEAVNSWYDRKALHAIQLEMK